MNPSTLQIYLDAADAEFQLIYSENRNDPWHSEVRQRCKYHGSLAVQYLLDNDPNNALKELEHARSSEGEYCGWLDNRAYNYPYNYLDNAYRTL